MSSKDRVKFGKNLIKNYDADVWTREVAFYFDGASFVHKQHPKSCALAPRERIWRRKNEGLQAGCLAKGNKEGIGRKSVKMFVVISYGEGVICAHPYEKLNGENFSQFVRKNFNGMFAASGKQSRLWIQDGIPLKIARKLK